MAQETPRFIASRSFEKKQPEVMLSIFFALTDAGKFSKSTFPASGFYDSSYYSFLIRTKLDWESCTLEFVIIASLGSLYFAWLERGKRLNRN